MNKSEYNRILYRIIMLNHCQPSIIVSVYVSNLFYLYSNTTNETKDYIKNMNVENARTKFQLRTEMLDVKFNYKHSPINVQSLWQCESCQTNIETQSHIMWCPAYSELREGKDITNDNDLIEYVRKVLKIRENLNLTK